MQNGKVKFFNDSKGYGFIEGQDKDYFVHFSAIKNGRTLKEGQKVTFSVGVGKKGPVAEDVNIEFN